MALAPRLGGFEISRIQEACGWAECGSGDNRTLLLSRSPTRMRGSPGACSTATASMTPGFQFAQPESKILRERASPTIAIEWRKIAKRITSVAFRTCWDERPPSGIDVPERGRCRSQPRETVYGTHLPNWHGYVETHFSASWGECCWAHGSSQEAAAQGHDGVLREACSDGDCDRGLRRFSSLGATVAVIWP